MKTNVKDGELISKKALFLAQSKLGSDKLQDKKICLEKAEEKLESFIEHYLYLSWIPWAIISVMTIVLSIIFPPQLVLNLLNKYDNSLWVFIIYGLLITVIFAAFFVGLFFVLDIFGTLCINLKGRKIDKELVAWANSRSRFKFKILPAAISVSYGAWQWSLVQACDEFYDAVRSYLSSIISHGAKTTEEAYGLASGEFLHTLKNDKSKFQYTNMIIACYVLISLYDRGLENTKDVLSMQ